MRHLICSFALVATLTSPALAQTDGTEWYAGAAIGQTELRFEPYYTFLLGGEPDLFIDHQAGLQADIVAGRRHAVGGRLSIGYQGLIQINRIAWELSIPEEPADLRYTLPYTVIGSLVPAWRVASAMSIFAEIGGGMGRVREYKASPTSSTYDVDQMQAVLGIGAGAAFRVGGRFDVVAAYRHGRYADFSYDTVDPAGVLIEHVQDAPTTHGVSVGVSVVF